MIDFFPRYTEKTKIHVIARADLRLLRSCTCSTAICGKNNYSFCVDRRNEKLTYFTSFIRIIEKDLRDMCNYSWNGSLWCFIRATKVIYREMGLMYFICFSRDIFISGLFLYFSPGDISYKCNSVFSILSFTLSHSLTINYIWSDCLYESFLHPN